MMSKTCTKCSENKEYSLFSPHKKTKDRLQSWCKSCVASTTRVYSAAKERIRRENPEYRAKQNAQHMLYKSKNKDKINALKRAATIRRRITAKQATPAWGEKEFEQFVFLEAYNLAKLRKKMLHSEWHVDHVVPLQGKLVSGFHISNNIQVILAKDNLQKSNKFVGS